MKTELLSAFTQPLNVIRLIALLISLGHLLATAQLLANRSLLKDNGVLSWQSVRLRHPLLQYGPLERLFASLFGYPNILALLFLRLGIAAWLMIVSIGGYADLFSLLAIVAINGVLAIRLPYGSNAADEMMSIVAVALLLGSAGGSGSTRIFCLWFIAAQGCLAYFTAGIFKSGSAGWYDGSYLRELFSTGNYGSQWAARIFTSKPLLAKLVGTLVVVGETSFVLLLFVPAWLCALCLLIAVVFHLAIAKVMGLNLFVWSFTSTYPAVLFCNLFLHSVW